MNRPGILMVTGAYLPELSGGGLQCRTMIHALGDECDFSVLTTCVDPALLRLDVVEGVRVTRVFVDVARPSTKIAAAWHTLWFFLRTQGTFDIVHLHGFSQKSILIARLARVFGKRLVITIHTAGHDEPEGVKRLGRLAFSAYARADRFVAISARMAANYRASGLPAEKLMVAPNGIDTSRFRPPSPGERESLRAAIPLPADIPWILFVGFFSKDKAPDVLFEAWLRLRARTGRDSALIFVGATASRYYEVDRDLMNGIRAGAARNGVAHLVHFAGEVADVERWYRMADAFAMPSVREAFGLALAEAMASGLPVVATRIAGVTDAIVDDGVTGRLVPPGDVDLLAAALAELLDPEKREGIGIAARRAIEGRYGLEASRRQWRQIYK